MKKVGIRGMTSYLPKNEISSKYLSQKFTVSDEFLENKTGFVKLYKKDDSDDAFSLAKKGLDKFRAEHNKDYENIDMIISVTQNGGAIRMPHLSALIQGYICPNRFIPTFDINLGCSGWVYALDIAKGMMSQSNRIKNTLVITSDPYSDILDENDKNTSLLFSDASTVTLLSSEDYIWEIGEGLLGTNGHSFDVIYRNRDEKLQMNGRALFDTVVKTIPREIEQTLHLNSLNQKDVDKFVLHQASRYVIDFLSNRMGLKDKMPFVASNVGNVISSSIPLVFENIVTSNDKVVCVCGFGVGFSWGCNILNRKGK